ncbi:cupin domain-containing protein [Novacetimonas hansenii]|uniref:cupin domain-containing protein n=1 Tax=Novacetimonas hansenii TaxID=436 RepID=UPI00094FB585|nr:cupin domain-containing protein [Novacetimonas hansenii]PYD72499.1 cupin [Novacetimonas hansenii]
MNQHRTQTGRRQFQTILGMLGLVMCGKHVRTARGAAAMRNAPDAFMLSPDGWVPNNAHLPVLHYHNALPIRGGDPAAGMEALFTANGWPPRWRWGVYDFHHYHSTAHEVLGIIAGSAQLRLGGPGGRLVTVRAGDVVVLPAGTGHRNEGSSNDFLVVGAYPPDQDFDLQRGPITRAAITVMGRLPFPPTDPVQGRAGALTRLWHPA